MEVYSVGGSVRDKLLNKTPKDFDYVVVNSSPTEMLSRGFKQVGNDFPVFLHPRTNEEYALARTEKKTGKSYTDFSCEWENVTIEEDLFRRDFTVNSIAIDKEGNYIDPYHGMEDIDNKILRCTNPNAFKDDPLRVLRLARFYAQLDGFRIYHATRRLAKEMVIEFKKSNLTLTPERILLETNKALMTSTPSKYFYFLEEIDLLEVLYPELHKMTFLEHGSKHHLEGSVFEHTMMVIDQCHGDLESKYMCLYHDIGKTVTVDISKKEPLNSLIVRYIFHGHEDHNTVAPLVDDMKHRYKLSNNIYNNILWSASYHSFVFRVLHREHRSGTIISKVTDKKFPRGFDNIKRLFDIGYCDAMGRVTKSNKLGDKYDDNVVEDLAHVVDMVQKVSVKEYLVEKPDASFEDMKQYKHRVGINLLKDFYVRNSL
jgi:tRNA nucleotidyltransferase (CCA-adding enzyme)